MTSWKKLILEEMKFHGETFDDVVRSTLSNEEMDVEFKYPLGEMQLWTHGQVYYSFESDGYYYVDSMPRNPE